VSGHAARIVRILYAALVVGLVLMGVVLAVARRFGQTQSFSGGVTIGMVLAGVGVVQLAVATVFLRSRMPERQADQSADAYWMTPEARVAAIVLWGVVQSAGLFASVGYFLTGAVAPVVVDAGAFIALALFRPSRLEGTE
jgi:hypothetical protein